MLPGDPWLLYPAQRFNDTPLLIGSNSDKGGIFLTQPVEPSDFEAIVRQRFGEFGDRFLALYPASEPEAARKALADMIREQPFAWPTYSWARKQAEYGTNSVYIYYFDYKTPQSP